MGRTVMTDDLERDQVLHQRILLFSWIKEEYFDISTGEGSQGFIGFAQRGRETAWPLALSYLLTLPRVVKHKSLQSTAGQTDLHS